MQNDITPKTPEEESLELTIERIRAMSDEELVRTYIWAIQLIGQLAKERSERDKQTR